MPMPNLMLRLHVASESVRLKTQAEWSYASKHSNLGMLRRRKELREKLHFGWSINRNGACTVFNKVGASFALQAAGLRQKVFEFRLL